MNILYNNFYDYSMVEYINNKTKVKIICPIHDEFLKRPNDHLNGVGCSKCSKKYMDTKYFIEKSDEIHKGFYDYSMVEYINNKTKVKIICPIHDEFSQLPGDHMKKHGCPDCVQLKKKTTKQFIKEAIEIYGDKYNFSLVEYINSMTKVKIICPVHGEFMITPNNFLSKNNGCPDCNNKRSKGELEIKNFLLEKNIKFKEQKTFEGCVFKYKLKFDFYLPDYNLCIEYDGQQHFEKYRFEKDDTKLKIRQQRDQTKNEYCKNNNINLLRIKYNENIIKKLKIHGLGPL
jgi:very-short-patch-repair endonuclease